VFSLPLSTREVVNREIVIMTEKPLFHCLVICQVARTVKLVA